MARTDLTAPEMASGSRPGLMLLDIGLPRMDGYQVAQHLRARPEFKDVTMFALPGFNPANQNGAAADSVTVFVE